MEGKEDGLQLGTELKLGRLEETIDSEGTSLGIKETDGLVLEGSVDGASDGSSMGLSLGLSLGEVEGSLDGANDGSSLGAPLG